MRLHSLPIDFVGFQDHGDYVLLAAATGVDQDTPAWAAQFRRDQLALDQLPNAEFFALAAINNIYIWKQPKAADALPDVQLNTAKMFAKALDRTVKDLKAMTPGAFKTTFGLWLQDLAEPSAAREHLERQRKAWFTESGFLESIMYMEVQQQVALAAAHA